MKDEEVHQEQEKPIERAGSMKTTEWCERETLMKGGVVLPQEYPS